MYQTKISLLWMLLTCWYSTASCVSSNIFSTSSTDSNWTNTSHTFRTTRLATYWQHRNMMLELIILSPKWPSMCYSASTNFTWNGHFLHCFVKCFLQDTPTNFYRNWFIFNQHRAKNKLVRFFLDMVYKQLLSITNTILHCAC